MEIQLEGLLKKVPSLYKLAILVSRRTLEISEGSPKLISTKLEEPLQIALEEIREGRITYKGKETK